MYCCRDYYWPVSALPACFRMALAVSLGVGLWAGVSPAASAGDVLSLAVAQKRGAIYSECGRSAQAILRGWLVNKQDPKTHLFSRGRQWDYHDEAADHYSSLVLLAQYLDPSLIQEGALLHRTLRSSTERCATSSGLPAIYDLKTGTRGKVATLTQLAEWLRDGLIRIAEILGRNNDWYHEMERLVNAILAESARQGGICRALRDAEGQGNMLQTLVRLYAMSGKEQYLTAAETLADSVLLGEQRPLAWDRFGDHGCELVPGLGELFVLECQRRRAKALAYREPLQRLLDATLAAGAHPVSGLFCQSKPAPNGQRSWQRPPDTWGYVLFTYENYDRATGAKRYRAAIEKPLRWLLQHRHEYASLKDTLWPNSRSSDDWSDSYESMIVLCNRYPQVGDAFSWLDWATLQHVHRRQPSSQHPYGPYTGGHFDGSTGRTLCMHMMLCSQGVRVVPFGEGVEVGAVPQDNGLLLTLRAERPWAGRLAFDGPRGEYPTAIIDWARLNEMPQWFVVRPQGKYGVRFDDGPVLIVAGSVLLAGLPVRVESKSLRTLRVMRAS